MDTWTQGQKGKVRWIERLIIYNIYYIFIYKFIHILCMYIIFIYIIYINIYIYIYKVLVTQSCLTLCYPIDCSQAGSSVHGIFQTRILEWIVIIFSSGSSWSRDQTQTSQIAGRLFTISTTREAHIYTTM